MTAYYLYTEIPGSGKGWTLAVLAITRQDADEYIKCRYQGYKGKYLGKTTSGQVNAHCGAITEKAHDKLFGGIE